MKETKKIEESEENKIFGQYLQLRTSVFQRKVIDQNKDPKYIHQKN